MKYSFAVAAFAASAVASPTLKFAKRQAIDFDAYEAIPKLPAVSAPIGVTSNAGKTSYDQSAAVGAAVDSITSSNATGSDAAVVTINTKREVAVAGSIERRGTCYKERSSNVDTQFTLTGTSDTAANFLSQGDASGIFATAALNAPAPVGFSLVDGFQNLKAAAEDSGYMTYISSDLTSYDPGYCARVCRANSGCTSFNIYFERDPTFDPINPSCNSTNPASVTYLKCSLFKSVLTSRSATNKGQGRGDFQIVIAGSNSYTLTTPVATADFGEALKFGSATVEDHATYMGLQTFTQDVAYDPAVCAQACMAKSQFDLDHDLPSAEKPDICNFFGAYILYKNDRDGVFTCTYYNVAHDFTYANNYGQMRGSDNYTIGASVGFNLLPGHAPTKNSSN